MNFFAFLWKLFQTNKTGGLIPQSPDLRDYPYQPENIQILPSVSLRNDFRQADDQGTLNSCSAYAMGAMLDYFAKKKKENKKWENFDFSENYQWYWSRYLEGSEDSNTGVVLRNCFKTVQKYGFTDQTLWSWQDGWRTAPSPKAQQSAEFFKLYLGFFNKYLYISRGDIDTVKKCLSEGFPVVFGIDIDKAFTKLKGSLVVSSIKNPLFGHAMIVVGYGPEGFLVRNSWGKRWGDKGYCTISEELFKLKAFDMWTLR